MEEFTQASCCNRLSLLRKAARPEANRVIFDATPRPPSLGKVPGPFGGGLSGGRWFDPRVISVD